MNSKQLETILKNTKVTKNKFQGFLLEIFRVLKPGGWLEVRKCASFFNFAI